MVLQLYLQPISSAAPAEILARAPWTGWPLGDCPGRLCAGDGDTPVKSREMFGVGSWSLEGAGGDRVRRRLRPGRLMSQLGTDRCAGRRAPDEVAGGRRGGGGEVSGSSTRTRR